MSSDGSLIVTEYLIYVPDEENPLTPGAQASAADMLCAYSADDTLLFEVMAGSCSFADIEMEPNIPFLHARGDIDHMMICPELQKIWIMRRGNLFAFSYDAASLKEMGATIPS